MASGLPVFSSDQAGAAELIRSGKDGFVLALNEWVEATALHLRDRRLLERVGSGAEETARRHDWQSVITKVEQLYQIVVA
jgi:glycosyltransferase involved in cell wall biosynthesis